MVEFKIKIWTKLKFLKNGGPVEGMVKCPKGLLRTINQIQEQIHDLFFKRKNIYILRNKITYLTRSMRDSETSIDFVQGSPGSRRERVNWEVI